MSLRGMLARLAGRPARSRGGERPSADAQAGARDVVGVLVATGGDLAGEVYRVYDGENRLGRAEASDVVLPSRWISREHAAVVHHEGVFALVSLSESSRTWLNGEEVDGSELSDGDAIRLGHTTFRFLAVEAPRAGR